MGKVIIKNKNDLILEHKSENIKYEYFKYLATDGPIDNQCTVKFYDIPPQKSNYPYHYHEKNVEIFYVISGEGELETEEGIKSIASGDLIICPPGELSAHKITNTSQVEKLSYIEFDTVHKPEVIKYPSSQKVGIIGLDGKNVFFKEKDNKEYYDGE